LQTGLLELGFLLTAPDFFRSLSCRQESTRNTSYDYNPSQSAWNLSPSKRKA
jgi:hypothetical protein